MMSPPFVNSDVLSSALSTSRFNVRDSEVMRRLGPAAEFCGRGFSKLWHFPEREIEGAGVEGGRREAAQTPLPVLTGGHSQV